MTIDIIERATNEVIKSIAVKSEREADRTIDALLEQVNFEDFYIRRGR